QRLGVRCPAGECRARRRRALYCARALAQRAQAGIVVNVVESTARWLPGVAMRALAIGCAIGALWLAASASWDVYLIGFPDSHFTDYGKAFATPRRVLMWAQWCFVLVFLTLAVLPIRTRTRVIGSLVALVALASVAIIQRFGVPWYFITHLGLDNGIG